MESEILQNFIKEAEIYLPMIRNGILVCSQEGNSGGDLETSLRYTQAIKHAAIRVGFEEISSSGVKLEQELNAIIGANEPLSALQIRNLLDNIAHLEALLAKLQFSGDDFSMNLEGFIDQSFTNLGFDSLSKKPKSFSVENKDFAEPVAEDELEGFEIDEEMLEIFAEEADDLLRNINTHLEILKSVPDNRDSLLEIRRNAHTLKGSAGIVGIKPLSNLAHRVEDLLDYLSDKQIDGNQKIFELLQNSTDCLSALSSGENSAQLTKRIQVLYTNFDETLKSLENGTFLLDEKMPTNEEAEFEAILGQSKAENQSTAAAHKPVVRVSLEKLDELVRLVGDLVISRSVFEQRLAEFERQISELHHSTNRLTRSTNKLETDFEASMLQVPSSKFQVPGQSNSSLITQNSSLNFDAI